MANETLSRAGLKTPNAAAIAGLPIFASGLGVLGLFGWRRKWKAQPAT